MSLKTVFAAVALAVVAPAMPALACDAHDLRIEDAYARSAMATAKTGAIFFKVMNGGGVNDRLIAVSTPIAKRAMLHTHVEEEGVMRMLHVMDGFEVPAEGMLVLKRGGHHVMLMGLDAPLKQGDLIPLTLTFQQAGDKRIEVLVDLERTPGDAAQSGHGDH